MPPHHPHTAPSNPAPPDALGEKNADAERNLTVLGDADKHLSGSRLRIPVWFYLCPKTLQQSFQKEKTNKSSPYFCRPRSRELVKISKECGPEEPSLSRSAQSHGAAPSPSRLFQKRPKSSSGPSVPVIPARPRVRGAGAALATEKGAPATTRRG